MGELFFQIGGALVLAAACSFLAYRLRQPLIVAYVLTGLIAGPSVLGLLQNGEALHLLSQFGVAFLLFTVGLGLNWRAMKEVGGVALATGIGQVIFTSLVGYPIGRAFGLDPLTAAYASVAFAFSSTIIIVKLLSDKEELDSLYGRISVGFLLVQDFIAMFILLALGAVRGGGDVVAALSGVALKSVVLVPVAWVLAAFVMPRVVAYAARSQELLLVFSIAWAVLVAGILAHVGFGLELGALVAGIMLSGTPFERDVQARVRPLRDFFLVLFFVALGAGLNVADVRASAGMVAAFSVFILLGNPLIVLFIMRLLGHHPRTGFLAGTTVAQISEFSFIVLAAGAAIGHVPAPFLGVATMVGLITIAGSAYLVEFNDRIYDFLRPVLRFLEPHDRHGLRRASLTRPLDLVLIGFHRVGEAALDVIRETEKRYAVVDFDPEVLSELSAVGVPVLYGDASDGEFLSDIAIERIPFVICAVPDMQVGLALLAYLRRRHHKGTVIVTARTAHEAAQCYAAGASYVIIPNVLGGVKFRELLEKKGTRAASWRLLGEKERDILEPV